MLPQCLGSRGRGIMSSRLSLVSMDYMRPCLKKKKKINFSLICVPPCLSSQLLYRLTPINFQKAVTHLFLNTTPHCFRT